MLVKGARLTARGELKSFLSLQNRHNRGKKDVPVLSRESFILIYGRIILMVADLVNSSNTFWPYGFIKKPAICGCRSLRESKISWSVSCGRKSRVADGVAVCRYDRDEKCMEFQLLSSSAPFFFFFSNQSYCRARVTDLLLGRSRKRFSSEYITNSCYYFIL